MLSHVSMHIYKSMINETCDIQDISPKCQGQYIYVWFPISYEFVQWRHLLRRFVLKNKQKLLCYAWNKLRFMEFVFVKIERFKDISKSHSFIFCYVDRIDIMLHSF